MSKREAQKIAKLVRKLSGNAPPRKRAEIEQRYDETLRPSNTGADQAFFNAMRRRD